MGILGSLTLGGRWEEDSFRSADHRVPNAEWRISLYLWGRSTAVERRGPIVCLDSIYTSGIQILFVVIITVVF